MAEPTAEVLTIARVDLEGFNRKMDEHDKRIEKSKEKAKSGAFFGGLVGGAVGAAAGSAESEAFKPITTIGELFGDILAAAFAPLLLELVPALRAFAQIFESEAWKKFVKWVTGGVDFLGEGLSGLRDEVTGQGKPASGSYLDLARSRYAAIDAHFPANDPFGNFIAQPLGAIGAYVGTAAQAAWDLSRGDAHVRPDSVMAGGDTDSPYSNRSRSGAVG